jgi:Spy/CpxP family protein refolding chaperone
MKKIKIIMFMVLALLILFPSVMIAQPGPNVDGGAISGFRGLGFIANHKWWKIETLAEKMELTEEQEAELESLYKEYNEDVHYLRADLKTKRFELEMLLDDEVFDMDKIEKVVDELLEKAKEVEKFEMMSRIRILNVLNYNQRKILITVARRLPQREREEREPQSENGKRKGN